MRISACIITRDDKKLVDAVASVRPFVDEVCIVDTGTSGELGDHGMSAALGMAAKAFGDGTDGEFKWVPFDGCNDADGKIANFSAARRVSFAMATGDWIVWIDSDDVVEGLENLRPLLASIPAERSPRLMCPYEYAYELGTGAVAKWQMRERVVRNDGKYTWKYPVHEILVSDGKPDDIECLDIVWKHMREPGDSSADPDRNLRILRAYEEKARKDAHPLSWRNRSPLDTEDAWLCLNLGTELKLRMQHEEARGYLRRFIALSNWTDQNAMAWLSISDCCGAIDGLGDQTAARQAAEEAFALRSEWFDCSYQLAKLDLVRGVLKGDRGYLRRAIVYAEHALSLPETKTPIARNPRDRERAIHDVVIVAHQLLGQQGLALSACGEAASLHPDDTHFDLAFREMSLDEFEDAQDVVIACIPTPEAWNPVTMSQKGIGGSETAIYEMARRLAADGSRRVRVYTTTHADGLWDKVEYRPWERMAEVGRCDLLIGWRGAGVLEHIRAKQKWLWVHDAYVFNPSPWHLHLADKILVLSEWHRERIARMHATIADLRPKLQLTANGIDVSRFAMRERPRNPHKAIYSSSPDRGLMPLLSMWPAIRARVPDAELHVFYGTRGLEPEQRDEIAPELARLAGIGVVNHGRVNQAELAQELLSAGVWLYPSWYSPRNCRWEETSCIAAMEAQAAGLRLVCSSYGALAETAAGPMTTFVDYAGGDPDSRIRFMRAAVTALKAPIDESTRVGCAAVARARFDWDAVAHQWTGMMAGVDLEKADIPDPTDGLPVMHMVLVPGASGNTLMDPSHPGGEAQGGGSRVGYLGLLQAMANLGRYHIRAFSTFSQEIWRDGVHYIPIDRFVDYPQPDILFAYYGVEVLATAMEHVLRIASHHTYLPYGGVDNADVHTAPSQHAVDALEAEYPNKGEWCLLPNGVPDAPIPVDAAGAIDLSSHVVDGRLIFHTSFDRGLHLLFQCWPEIRRRVPHATLHVIGPIGRLVTSPSNYTGATKKRIQLCADTLPAAQAAGGLTVLDPLPRAELLRELREAQVFAFPCSCVLPSETFSLSLMECARMGIPIVLAPADALESIYAGSVLMTPAPVEEHLPEFTDAVVAMLTDPAMRLEYQARGLALAAPFTFERQADVLDAIIQKHTKTATEAVCREAAE